MSDDVASFFKSKKSKKNAGAGGQRAHNSNVQDPDALARRLERTVQQQQVFDRENGYDENEDEFDQPRPPYSQQMSGGGGGGGGAGIGGEQNNEESEWLDVKENQDIDLAKLGIKEMEIREESDSEGNEDEETLNNRKTWNIPGQQKDKQQAKAQKIPHGAAGMDIDEGEEGGSADEKPPIATNNTDEAENNKQEGEGETEKEDAGEQKTKYVPPSLRNKQLAAITRQSPSMKQPNLEDSMEFPSLAAAGELAAEIEKSKKKKQPPPPQQPMKKAWSPAPVSTPSSAVPISTNAEEPPEPSPTSAPQQQDTAGAPTKSSYVPPHLRKRGGAS